MIELANSSVIHFDPELIDEYRNRMLVDGYFNIDAGKVRVGNNVYLRMKSSERMC